MWNEDITFQESLNRILPAIAGKIQERMPDTGKFKRFGYWFDVDESWIREGGLWFDYDGCSLPEGRKVILSGRFPGENRQMEEDFFCGNKSEIINYLKSPEAPDALIERIHDINEKIRIHD